MKTLADVKKAIEKMHLLMNRNSHLGAADTEPDAEFQSCIRNYIGSHTVRLPKRWHLFSAVEGAAQIEKQMNACMLEVLTAIGGTHWGCEYSKVVEFLEEEILWRC